MARFCSTVSCSTSTVRSLSSAKRRSDSSQSVAVGDVGRGAAERAHHAFVGEAGAGQQIHQHFGSRLVETMERGGLSARQLPIAAAAGAAARCSASPRPRRGSAHRRSLRPVAIAGGAQPIPLLQGQRHHPDAAAPWRARRENRCRRSSARRALWPSRDSATPGRRRDPSDTPRARRDRWPPCSGMSSSIRVRPGCASEIRPPAACTIAVTSAGDGPTRSTNAGLSLGQPQIEGRLHGLDVAGGHHRARHVRPRQRHARRAARHLDLGLEVDRHLQLGQPLDDGFDPRDPLLALLGQERHQPGVAGLEEVAEHVHVAAAQDRGDLDARHRLDAALARRTGERRPPPRWCRDRSPP